MEMEQADVVVKAEYVSGMARYETNTEYYKTQITKQKTWNKRKLASSKNKKMRRECFIYLSKADR